MDSQSGASQKRIASLDGSYDIITHYDFCDDVHPRPLRYGIRPHSLQAKPWNRVAHQKMILFVCDQS